MADVEELVAHLHDEEEVSVRMSWPFSGLIKILSFLQSSYAICPPHTLYNIALYFVVLYIYINICVRMVKL